jgi:lincosamide nucleotidyltransferase A/C/D/E
MKREMTSSALVELLRSFEAAGVPVWLDGGWGVDALLERQTRPHKDVDLSLRVADVPKLQETLGRRGFAIREGVPPKSLVLADGAGLEVDVHAVVFDGDGNGVYRMENGKDWIFPAEAFGGRGVVEGVTVRDMELLRDRFPIELPPQLRRSRE